jgi:uncharacterized protein YcaQ
MKFQLSLLLNLLMLVQIDAILIIERANIFVILSEKPTPNAQEKLTYFFLIKLS